LLVGTVPPVAPELIRSMQEQQRELTQELLDKARAICAEHGVCADPVPFFLPSASVYLFYRSSKYFLFG
jgi:hypothetical protein